MKTKEAIELKEQIYELVSVSFPALNDNHQIIGISVSDFGRFMGEDVVVFYVEYENDDGEKKEEYAIRWVKELATATISNVEDVKCVLNNWVD